MCLPGINSFITVQYPSETYTRDQLLTQLGVVELKLSAYPQELQDLLLQNKQALETIALGGTYTAYNQVENSLYDLKLLNLNYSTLSHLNFDTLTPEKRSIIYKGLELLNTELDASYDVFMNTFNNYVTLP